MRGTRGGTSKVRSSCPCNQGYPVRTDGRVALRNAGKRHVDHDRVAPVGEHEVEGSHERGERVGHGPRHSSRLDWADDLYERDPMRRRVLSRMVAHLDSRNIPSEPPNMPMAVLTV